VAFDTFLKLDGLDGESTRKGHEKQIEIFSFSWGASNPTTVGSSSAGLSAGKATVSSFNIMKKTDVASPTLFQKCCVGDHFKTANVVMNKASGDKVQPLAFLKYDFEQVFVESIQWSGSSGGDDSPTESVSFAFGKVTVTYTPQAATGAAAGSPAVASWDVQQVTAG
jgi:type VI secretion system secreted protein Hcp